MEARLEAALAHSRLLAADRHLCQELAYGIVRWQATLDWLVARKTAGRVQKPMLQNLLRLGLYELMFIPEIPFPIVINEALEIGEEFSDTRAPTS